MSRSSPFPSPSLQSWLALLAAGALWSAPVLADGEAGTVAVPLPGPLAVPLPVALLGRLHFPLLHFPIALLFGVLVVELFGGTRLQPQARRDFGALLLTISAVAAIVTAVSGLAYAQGEEFGGAAATTFVLHRAAGLVSTAVIVALAALRRAPDGSASHRAFRPALVLGVVLVTLTGHWGGELVHGEGFLTRPLRTGSTTKSAADVPGRDDADSPTYDPDATATAAARAPAASADDAAPARERWPEGVVPEKPDYARDIRPVFDRSCVKCHGPEKRKSGLRLDQKRYAFKGGESGPAIVPGEPDRSLVYTSCSAPDDDYDVMPPKGKLLAQSEIATVRRWIEQGAIWPDDRTP